MLNILYETDNKQISFSGWEIMQLRPYLAMTCHSPQKTINIKDPPWKLRLVPQG